METAFIANVEYQIRTLLNVVLGFSEQLADPEDRSRDQIRAGIHRASGALLKTLQETLDYLRIRVGALALSPVTLGVAAVIEEQVRHFQPIARAKGVVLAARIDVEDAAVLVDEYCLRQALANLRDNALGFTERSEIEVRLFREPNGLLSIDVKDTGIGMDEEQRSR